jgi:CheY-like chemotaxis protein
MNAKTWTVCVVEPNKFEGQIIVDLLRMAGVERVKVCADPADAMAALQVFSANIVIASFEMAPLGAAAWTRAFRRDKRLANRQAAIFITSHAFSRAVAEQCRHAGANALMGKPISGKVLIATITKVLAKPREFIDNAGEGYVGPCRRAGIVTAGAPTKRRQTDVAKETHADSIDALSAAVAALSAAAALMGDDDQKCNEACEVALRDVQGYAVDAGDGPLMRACAVFSLHLTSRGLQPDAAKAALRACAEGVAKLAELNVDDAVARDAVAEGMRQVVAKAAMQRAA